MPRRTAGGRRSADELHDVLRRLGDLIAVRAGPTDADLGAAAGWVAELIAERRAVTVRIEAKNG